MNKVILATLKSFALNLQNIEVCQEFIDYRDNAANSYKTYGRKHEQMLKNCDYLWLEWQLKKLGLVTDATDISYDCSLKECGDAKLELKGLMSKYFNIHPTGPSGFGGANWLEKNIKAKNFEYMVFWQFLEDFTNPLAVGDKVSVHIASVETGDEIWNNKRNSLHEAGGYYYTPKNLITRK